MPDTIAMRVPATVHAEAKQIGAVRGKPAGEMIAQAWREYLERNRAEFAGDLEEAARILRTGTRTELAAFVNRDNEERAKRAAAEARSEAMT